MKGSARILLSAKSPKLIEEQTNPIPIEQHQNIQHLTETNYKHYVDHQTISSYTK